MAIPKIKEQDVIDALKYIDENGVSLHNQRTKYELVTEEGHTWPRRLQQILSVICCIGSR